MERLLSTHEIITLAAQDNLDDINDDTAHLRLPVQLKADAQEYLGRHNVTISQFLRKSLQVMLNEAKQGEHQE